MKKIKNHLHWQTSQKVLQSQRQPCCSPFFTLIYSPVSGGNTANRGLNQAEESGAAWPFSAEKTCQIPDRGTAAGWGRSPAVCTPRPSPAKPTVGGRTSTTKRALSVFCFWLFTCGLTPELTDRCTFVVSYRYIFINNGGRIGLQRGVSPPAVCPQNPFRLHRNQHRLHGHLTNER